MPRPYSKKETEYQSEMVRSVFLYGTPNAGKAELVSRMQEAAAEHVNFCIGKIDKNPEIIFQLVKNDKKDPAVRAFEKTTRHAGWNSAFCQNAFDAAFTMLSNRLSDIRHDMMRECFDMFTSSKVLFSASVLGWGQPRMITLMEDVIAGYKKPNALHKRMLADLRSMPAEDFRRRQAEFADSYCCTCLLYKLPQVKSMPVPVDSRLGRLERSGNTTMPYVAVITNPFKRNSRITVPVGSSRTSLRRMAQYKTAATFTVSMEDGLFRCGCAFTKKTPAPESTKGYVGADTGILDCIHTSDGKTYGSMKEAITFYQDVVEPAFAYLSGLRNKKRSISHYLRHHKNLPADVRRSLIEKIDRLEHMIREAKAPYRKKRRYYMMLDHEIASCVRRFIKETDPSLIVALEKLDIREFRKSRKVNGMLSIFARGKLAMKLMDELNWHGRVYEQVEPAYTSQVCPECSFLDSGNRNGKAFRCLCCGYKDDADKVGAVNICRRAQDEDVKKICLDSLYSHKKLQAGLESLYADRHSAWKKAHPEKAEPAA
jgi:hypothetical protein